MVSSSGLMVLLVALLSAVSFAGLGFLIFGRKIAHVERRSRRLDLVAGRATSRGSAAQRMPAEARDRRKALQESLKQIEERNLKRTTRAPLKMQLAQAGLAMTPRNFYVASAVAGVAVAAIAFFLGQTPLVALGAGAGAGLGLPRWVLGMMCKMRQKKFNEEFANSLEVIVRGVKAGLPLNECLQIIAREGQDPVRGEFAHIVDSLAIGVPLDEALDKMVERVPTAEVNFFVIVLSIQQKTGGNLSEALSNLASVLRDRKLMRAKIAAMSSEAKASAMIIGSLPFGVLFMVYMSTPDYIGLLFTEKLGNAMLLFGGAWMSTGILVMRKMINFKF
ncbi:MAG: type II secretion system F family protein [Alphaproteobacteria bacterium]|nr:type II secretion system F family protein [Alphaproteobacteria bacterium]